MNKKIIGFFVSVLFFAVGVIPNIHGVNLERNYLENAIIYSKTHHCSSNNNLDLAVTNVFDNNISVLINNGSGGFENQYDYNVGEYPVDIITGDFNSDNNLDLVVTNYHNDSVSVLINNGSGGFEERSDFTIENSPSFIVTGDFNKDSHLDLAVTTLWGDNLSILFGDGSGGFGDRQDYLVSYGPWYLVAGDFDSDNDLDLAITIRYNARVCIFFNDGSGGFGNQEYYYVGYQPYGIATGDFDSDNDLDLAVVCELDNYTSVFLNNGYGGFGDKQDYPVGDNPRFIVTGDFDSDSDLDLSITNRDDDDVSVLIGDGSGGFGNRQDYPVGDTPHGIVAGDFDSDNDLDLAIANSMDNDISLIFNNGNAGFFDRIDYSVGNGPFCIVAGDFETDGENQSPVAEFTWTPNVPNPEETVSFDASDSYDPDGHITFFEWDFDNDGEYDDATGKYTTWQWSNEGSYPVSLKVTDNESNNGFITKTVIVVEIFYFVHLTDTHVGTFGANVRFLSMKVFLNGLNPPPSFVVISGDLTDIGMVQPQDFITYGIIKNLFDMPVYDCMGNHDHLPSAFIPPLEVVPPFPSSSDIPVNNLHLIGMDSGGYMDWFEGWDCFPVPFPPFILCKPILDFLPEGTGLLNTQMEWLSNNVNNFPFFNNIIFMHHPIFNSNEEGYPNGNGCIWNNRDNFVNMIKNKVQVVLGGHTHSANEFIIKNNFVYTLFYKPTDGYNPLPDDGGYWDISYFENNDDYDLPMFEITDSCSEDLGFRVIEINGENIKVYTTNTLPPGVTSTRENSFNLKGFELETREIFGLGGYKNDMTEMDITAAQRLHVYDDEGNHVGINEVGGIDFEIQNAYYDNQTYIDPVTGEFINWSGWELINVLCNDSDSYYFEIEVFLNSTFNLTGSFKKDNVDVKTVYKNVDVFAGSVGNLFIEDGVEDYILYIDDDGNGEFDREIEPTIVYSPPNKPDKPKGEINGNPGIEYSYTSFAVDPEGDQVYYLWSWGDGNISGWLGPFDSGVIIEAKHTWTEKGSYEIKAKAMDSTGRETDWSDPLTVTMPRNKIVNRPFLQFLQSHPNLFPLLQKLIQNLGFGL